MSRALILGVLLVLGYILAACGATASGGGTTPEAAGASRPLTRSQAMAFVRAVNLRASDVPGFRVAPAHERKNVTETRIEHEIQGCVDLERGLAEGSAPSLEREQGGWKQGVSSEVSVARTSTEATADLARIRGGHTRECLSRYLALLFKDRASRGETVSPIAITTGTPPAPGTTGSFGWRIAATLTVHSVRVPFHFDLVGFVYGRAEVALFSSSVPLPFPSDVEKRLFSLLLARSKGEPEEISPSKGEVA